jgi:hypothetical protein
VSNIPLLVGKTLPDRFIRLCIEAIAKAESDALAWHPRHAAVGALLTVGATPVFAPQEKIDRQRERLVYRIYIL